MTDSWHSYPKVYAVGHNAVLGVFDDPVIVEEKVDGSQFSFGRFGDEIRMKSRGAIVFPESPGMFSLAVDAVSRVAHLLHDGWTYRGEYLMKPKHNSLCYSRVPANNIILFDINTGEEAYLTYTEKLNEADRLGFETVPLFYSGTIENVDHVLSFLERDSILGGAKIEGMVFKNYAKYTPDGKAMFAKFVSEAFKEVHGKQWKQANPTSGDVIEVIASNLRTEARWKKSIQRLRDNGELQNDPRDIGILLKEIQGDIAAECEQDIKESLYKWAKPHIMRKSVAGFPEFYKRHLLETSFEN